ncbi:MAG: hypothetical protein WCC10_16065, partial [Tumebacillaceae bacterium]
MINWLRNQKSAALILTLLRLYVGWKFLTAGWTKVTSDKAFDASGLLNGAVTKSSGQMPSVQAW